VKKLEAARDHVDEASPKPEPAGREKQYAKGLVPTDISLRRGENHSPGIKIEGRQLERGEGKASTTKRRMETKEQKEGPRGENHFNGDCGHRNFSQSGLRERNPEDKMHDCIRRPSKQEEGKDIRTNSSRGEEGSGGGFES